MKRIIVTSLLLVFMSLPVMPQQPMQELRPDTPLPVMPQQPMQELRPDTPLPVMVFNPGPEPTISISDGLGHQVLLRWVDGQLEAEGDYLNGAKTMFHLFEAQIRANLKSPCERPANQPVNCGPWKMTYKASGKVLSGNSCVP